MRRALLTTLAALTLGVAEAATARTTAELNLRRAPSPTSAALAVIPRGTVLRVACNGDWCRTTYQGRGGYIARAYTRASTFSAPLARPQSRVTPAAPGAVYYRNCTAARAAGAAPLRRGQPGYRAALDPNRNGIACE